MNVSNTTAHHKTELYLLLGRNWKVQSHHLGFQLSDVPQGQSSLNVNSVWQTSSGTAEARQELHDWLKAGRMSSITQNLESDNKLPNVTFGKSLDCKFMDWLWEEQKKCSCHGCHN